MEMQHGGTGAESSTTPRRHRGGRRRVRTAIALAGLLTLGVAGTVHAHPRVYEASDYDNAWTDIACDKYEIDGRDWGRVVILDARAKENYQFFYFTNYYNGHTKVTNPANGKWFTEDWSGTYKEVNARQYGDDPNVFAYEGRDTARYRVENRHGRVVYRDHGIVVTSFVFDTLGDFAPGGENVVDPVEVKNTWDPHFDFCKLADRLIG